MAGYELSWITENLAIGHAPMSYAELDSIRAQGIDAIINLCAEFCDLHEIEEGHGFEVYYLPTPDDRAPSMVELEEALEWLDEAVYLGKKVLVHCRLGIGRTGTFVTAYMLRRGFGLKLAKEKIGRSRVGATSFYQWRLLKKYGKKAGTLTIREPSLENRKVVDLSPFFLDYEALLQQVDESFRGAAQSDNSVLSCGRDSDECCYRLLDLQLIEAAYISYQLNRSLQARERQAVIERAVEAAKRRRQVEELSRELSGGSGEASREELRQLYARQRIRCPLSVEGRCILYQARPVACRLYGLPVSIRGEIRVFGKKAAGRPSKSYLDFDGTEQLLQRMSGNILLALSSALPTEKELTFSLPDTVSGRFVQQYFHYLAGAR